MNDIYASIARIQVWVGGGGLGGGGREGGSSKEPVKIMSIPCTLCMPFGKLCYSYCKRQTACPENIDDLKLMEMNLKRNRKMEGKKDMNCSKANRPWGGECLMSSYVHSL